MPRPLGRGSDVQKYEFQDGQGAEVRRGKFDADVDLTPIGAVRKS